MTSRLKTIIDELQEKCRKHNCFEFEYHWEMWGVLWYPWYIHINGKSESFSFNDISQDDLKELTKQGFIELLEEYPYNPDLDYFDRKRYRVIEF